MKTGAKIGSGFQTLFFWCLLKLAFHRLQKRGSVFGPRFGRRSTATTFTLELAFGTMNLDADQKSSARCSHIIYMIICGIQSYSLNCSQKEQGGSSSLHVRMYAQVLAPCSNCGGPLCKGTFLRVFPGSLMNPPNRQKLWATPSRRFQQELHFAPTVIADIMWAQ